MRNRELINKLMELPLNAEIDFTCLSCSCGTFYSSKAEPKIIATKETFHIIRIEINEGFDGSKVQLRNVTNNALVNEIKKRMVEESE